MSFKSKLKLFENMASVGTANGLVGLGQQSGKGLNPNFNLAAVGGGGRTRLNSDICADQPERGTGILVTFCL